MTETITIDEASRVRNALRRALIVNFTAWSNYVRGIITLDELESTVL